MSPCETAIVEGYSFARQLPDGRVIGLMQMVATVGLFVDITPKGYTSRYCYPSAESAIAAIQSWDGEGDPRGPWLKQKGIGIDRANPEVGQFAGVPIVEAVTMAARGTSPRPRRH